jgi:hypothetical protein
MVSPVVSSLVGAALIPIALWAPIGLSTLGLDNSRMNKRIKDAERPHPDEIRDNRAIAAQFVPMSMVNLTAGSLAGIGASLFVSGGRLLWPASKVPLALIVSAIVLIEFTGIAIVAYLSRPRWAWVEDSSIFRSYLRQLKARGWIGEGELAEVQKRRSAWLSKTIVRPLRSPHDLCELSLEFSSARQEWASSIRYNPVEFGARLRAEVSVKQARRWILHRRLWRLGIAPLMSGLAIAGLICGLISFTGLPASLSVLLFVPLSFSCVGGLYWIAFRVGRLDLVMTNRYLALERAQLRDCDRLIAKIEELHKREQVSTPVACTNSDAARVILRIGRWAIWRHQDGRTGPTASLD